MATEEDRALVSTGVSQASTSAGGVFLSGQGLFRDNVRSIEHACRITRVERMEHLVAGHIQPWRDSSNEQRLDGENGLLLTPTVDHLFDKGLSVEASAEPVDVKGPE